MKKKLAIASLLLGSSLFAGGIDGLSLKIGAGNVEIGSLSESATKIGAEFSFIKDKTKQYDVYMDLGFYKMESGSLTFMGMGGRYEVAKNIQVGISVGLSGYAFSETSSSETDLSGFAYGLNAKYKINQNHSFVADYKSGTLTDKTGILDVDVTAASVNYVYSF